MTQMERMQNHTATMLAISTSHQGTGRLSPATGILLEMHKWRAPNNWRLATHKHARGLPIFTQASEAAASSLDRTPDQTKRTQQQNGQPGYTYFSNYRIRGAPLQRRDETQKRQMRRQKKGTKTY